MKSYNSFLGEATEKDLQQMGANQKQIDILKKRQAQRGSGFSKPKEQGSHFHQKQKSSAIQKSSPSAIQKKSPKSSAIQKMKPQATELAKKAGGALVKKGIEAAKQKRSGALARTNPSSSRTGKEAVGVPMPKDGGTKTYDRINPDKTHKKGGDVMAPDEAAMRRDKYLKDKLDKKGVFQRMNDRRKQGVFTKDGAKQKLADTLYDAPGNILKTAGAGAAAVGKKALEMSKAKDREEAKSLSTKGAQLR